MGHHAQTVCNAPELLLCCRSSQRHQTDKPRPLVCDAVSNVLTHVGAENYVRTRLVGTCLALPGLPVTIKVITVTITRETT